MKTRPQHPAPFHIHSRLSVAGAALAAAAILVGVAPAQAAESVDAKTRMAEWQAAFNAHDAKRIAAMYTAGAEVIGIKPSGWVSARGPAAAEKDVTPYFAAFPDVRIAVTRAFHKGDLVIAEWVSDGTNTGSFMGAPATGKRAGIAGISFLWFDKNGLIRRARAVFDEITLAQQVGLAPGAARAIPVWSTAPTTWIEADAKSEAKVVAAARATWPATWSHRDHKGYDAAITDDAAHIELAGPTDFTGRAACLAELDMYAKALPDMHVDIDEAWGFRDVAILRFTFRGTMKGPIGPFKPTNKPIVIHGIDVDQIRDGKMARGVTYSDAVELLTHLGVLPPPTK